MNNCDRNLILKTNYYDLNVRLLKIYTKKSKTEQIYRLKYTNEIAT